MLKVPQCNRQLRLEFWILLSTRVSIKFDTPTVSPRFHKGSHMVNLKLSSRWVSALFAVPLLFVATACGGVVARLSSAATAIAPTTAPAGAATSAPKAAPVGAATKPKPGAKSTAPPLAACQDMMQANYRLGLAMAQLVNLTPSTDYSALTRVDSPFMVDMTKFRADLATLSKLPDPPNALFGTPSDSVKYFLSMAAVAEADIKANGKPFADTDAAGQKVIGLDTPWLMKASAFGLAIGDNCPNTEFLVPTAVSAAAFTGTKFTIGQTAPQGDMRITLNKVTTIPGVPGNLPDNGSRFVIFYLTVMNTSKAPLSVPFTSDPTVADKAGVIYYFNANTIMLRDPDMNDVIAVDVPPGGKLTGSIGYMLPINAGDITWSFVWQDHPPIVFAVKASEIVQVGAPISAATADALRLGRAKTVEALVTMAAQQDALEAAQTAMPGAPAPTDVPDPTEVPEPTVAP